MNYQHVDPKKLELETLAVLSLFFLILASIIHRQFLMYIGIALLVIALFIKPLAVMIARGWLAFAKILGTFNSKIVLTLVFYLFLTPIALLYRVFNKNCLSIQSHPKSTSMYVDRDHVFTASDLEKMW
jgi:hypothetical protein